MKFKYYLRGLGIGILISTIILSVSFAMKKNDLSDDEIIARAKELGMVMEDTGKDTIPKATETEDEIPKSTEDGFNTEQTDMQPGTTDSGRYRRMWEQMERMPYHRHRMEPIWYRRNLP